LIHFYKRDNVDDKIRIKEADTVKGVYTKLSL